jgi:catechol 2,3-dioxygenase-like lactoylglutathione lyase family enzyme
MNLNQVTISVSDFDASFEFYTNLGLVPIVKSEHYARFVCAGNSGNNATFSIHKRDEKFSGNVVYFESESSDKLDEKVNELKSMGFEFINELENKQWLWREIHLKDPDENILCIYYAGENRLNPPWKLQ